MARKPKPGTRVQRLTALADQQQRLANRYGLTTLQAARVTTAGVHLGFETGIDDQAALCGALEGREMETVEDVSGCADCAFVVRVMNLEYLIKDEDGWTGLYLPRNRR